MNRVAMNRVPVTVLTGFLGAGKTTLLRPLLSEAGGRRIAVIVICLRSSRCDVAL